MGKFFKKINRETERVGRKYKNLRGRNEIFFIFIFSLLAINVTGTLWEYILGNLSQKIMVQYTFKQSSQIANFLVFFLKFRLSPHFSWKSNSGCWNFNSIKSDSLIARSDATSERNSVVMGSNPTQANFL